MSTNLKAAWKQSTNRCGNLAVEVRVTYNGSEDCYCREDWQKTYVVPVNRFRFLEDSYDLLTDLGYSPRAQDDFTCEIVGPVGDWGPLGKYVANMKIASLSLLTKHIHRIYDRRNWLAYSAYLQRKMSKSMHNVTPFSLDGYWVSFVRHYIGTFDSYQKFVHRLPWMLKAVNSSKPANEAIEQLSFYELTDKRVAVLDTNKCLT